MPDNGESYMTLKVCAVSVRLFIRLCPSAGESQKLWTDYDKILCVDSHIGV